MTDHRLHLEINEPPSTAAAIENFRPDMSKPENQVPRVLAAKAQAAEYFDATLPVPSSSPVKNVTLTARENVVQIADGVKMESWNFGGTVPGPIMVFNEGDKVNFTFKNEGMMPHSIDFHAARTAPDKNYINLNQGESHSYTWTAGDSGSFMYHCGTPMALHHMAMGMYGATIVKAKELKPVDKEFALVQSEFYVQDYNKDGVMETDVDKSMNGTPDYVAFNGKANQYVDHPLEAKVGDKIRMWVVNAGPAHASAFHVVGTIFDAVYLDGNPKNKLEGMQTVSIPPGGGAMVEFTIKEPGKYPFVTHSFGDASKGAVGILEVTDPAMKK